MRRRRARALGLRGGRRPACTLSLRARPDALARRALGARLCCRCNTALAARRAATAVGRASQDAAGDLHAAAKPEPLRWSLGSHVRGRWTIAIRQRSEYAPRVSKSRTLAFELSAQRHTRVAISMRSMGGLHGLEQPHGRHGCHGRVPSVSVTTLAQRRSPRQTLSRAAQASARAARLGTSTHATHYASPRQGAANGRCRVTRPAPHTQRTYDTARGSHHDDRSPFPRLPLDL